MSALLSPENVVAHRSSYMMQASDSPVVTYIFAFLTLLLHTADTTIQWRSKSARSKKYLLVWIMILGLIFLIEIALLCYNELKRSRQRTGYSPALWALLELSTLLSLSIEVAVLWRIYYRLTKYAELQKQARVRLYLAVGVVLTLNGTAVILLITGYWVDAAVILQAIGNLSTLIFSSYFPVWVICEGSIRGLASEKKSWGVLFCVFITAAAAITSLVLLALVTPTSLQACQILLGQLILAFFSGISWTVLQGYKLIRGVRGETGLTAFSYD